jgi:endonuclease YncB( thermonuclease family)
MVFRATTVAALAAGLAAPAVAQTAVDGDTIKLNGITWRLWGIDAPEMKQWCNGQLVGEMAAGMLEMLTKGKTITCEDKGKDRYGRSIGLCRADGDDLGAAMVELGMAWAFVRYTVQYYPQEAKARQENLGVHALKCQPAWEWRKAQRTADRSTAGR